MTPLLQESELVTALDFNGFGINNSGQWMPVPASVTAFDDPRLIDQRNVPPGSITNNSVSAAAAIDQSKLSLNGVIPPAWLGNSSTQAAQGDLVERVAHKGASGGYVPLGSGGTFSSTLLASTGPQVGTVTKVGLSMPIQFGVVPNIITGADTFGVLWKEVPDNSWLGTINGPGPLAYNTGQLPVDMIPDLDASQMTSGLFSVEELPEVVGLGTGHAPGILPDTGSTNQGNFNDYFGRDASWKTIQLNISYQPTLPPVVITLLGYYLGQARISLFCPQPGSSLFFLTFNPDGLPPLIPAFSPTPNPTAILMAPGWVVQAYASKAGWNNPTISTYMPPVPTD